MKKFIGGTQKKIIKQFVKDLMIKIFLIYFQAMIDYAGIIIIPHSLLRILYEEKATY